MTGSQTPSPSQMLEYGQHYEAEGNFDYANRFYSHIVDYFPAAPEVPEARAGLERIAQQQNLRRPGDQPGIFAPSGFGYEDVPRTNPPRLSLDVGARPVRSQSAAKASPPGGPSGPSSAPPSAAPSSPAPSSPASKPRQAQAPAQANPSPVRNEPSLGGYPASRQPPPARAGDGPSPQGPASRGPAMQPFPAAHAPPPQSAPLQAPQGGSHVTDPAAGKQGGEVPRLVRREGDTDEEDGVEFVPGYRIGRLLAFLVVLFGWLAFVAGAAFAALAVAGVAGSQPVAAWGGMPLGVVVGVAGVLAAIVMVFLGSLAQAAFEAANNTRELLEIERAKAGW